MNHSNHSTHLVDSYFPFGSWLMGSFLLLSRKFRTVFSANKTTN